VSQKKIRAVYMRGGTSRCLVFHHGDLPAPGPAEISTFVPFLSLGAAPLD